MAKSRMFSKSVKFLLIAFFAITVFLPLAAMFSKVKLSAIGGILKNPQFGKTVLNSLSVTLAATVLSVLIAYLLALAVNRSRIPCKRLITILATLPMLCLLYTSRCV